MTDLTSPELIQRFNRAAGLAREERYEESLAEWTRLLEPDEVEVARRRRDGGPTVSGRFLGLAHMRRAWVLMDLDRHAEARAELESTIVEACLSQLSIAELYEHYFSLANCCGAVGDIDAMDVAFSRALHLAAEELGDVSRCLLCWNNLIEWATRAGAWAYVERECPTALRFADNTRQPRLADRARRALAEAQRAR